MHTILKDGRVYDRLNPETHAVKQIAASFARDMPGCLFTVQDESGEAYYEISVSPPKSWKVANGPFTTGGDVTERDLN